MSKIDVIAVGEVLIDLIANKPGKAMESQTTFTRFPGGAPANFAVIIKKLGLNSAVITKIGEDFFGKFLLQTLKDENIDVSQIATTKEYKTALAFVGLDVNKTPNFSFYRSPCADIMLKPEEIDESFIKQAKLLMFGTVSMADQPACSSIKKAIKIAKKHELMVACDPNLRDDLWHFQDPREHILDVITDTDIFLPSISEAEFITGKKGSKAIEEILEYGPKIVGLTEGSQGSTIFTKQGKFRAPAYDVPVLDTTGAGDAFSAGLCAALLAEMPYESIPYFANAVSAIKIQRRGAMSGPSKDEVNKFILNQKTVPKSAILK